MHGRDKSVATPVVDRIFEQLLAEDASDDEDAVAVQHRFYRATAMLSAIYAVVVCPSVCVCVCVCVCLSHSGVVSKLLNVGSRK